MIKSDSFIFLNVFASSQIPAIHRIAKHVQIASMMRSIAAGVSSVASASAADVPSPAAERDGNDVDAHARPDSRSGFTRQEVASNAPAAQR